MKSVMEFRKVFIHRGFVDMRKSINGLSIIVQEAMAGNFMEPHLFVFCNRRRDLMKVLYFDKSGFCIWLKQLQKDKFPWPKKITDTVVQLTPEQFSWLLEGYDVWRMKPFENIYFERVI